MTFDPNDPLIEAVTSTVTRQGGRIVEFDEHAQLITVETADGTDITLNVDRMRSLVQSGEETIDSVIVRFLGVHDRFWASMQDEHFRRAGVRIALEPRQDFDEGDTVIYQDFSEQLIAVVEWEDPEATALAMLDETLISEWPFKDEIWQTAGVNMNKLLSEAELQKIDVGEGLVLATLNTSRPALKAALILAPNLKAKVEPELGWPIMVVAPCRDFIYLFPVDERGGDELASMLGETVLDEYESSPYPLSTEIFLISDEGIAAIAEFQPSYTAPEN